MAKLGGVAPNRMDTALRELKDLVQLARRMDIEGPDNLQEVPLRITVSDMPPRMMGDMGAMSQLDSKIRRVLPGLDSLIGSTSDVLGRSISPGRGTIEKLTLKGGLPAWAQALKLTDRRGTLPWDTDQYIGLVGIGGALIEGVLDTGGGRSMMDVQTATDLGLNWMRAKGDEYGTYSVPGHGYKGYAGVTGPVTIHFEDQIELACDEIKLIDHPWRLVLIGADVLRSGRTGRHGWEFRAIGGSRDAAGKIQGFVEF